MDLHIAVTRLHKVDGSGSIKAFVDISILDSLVINGLRIIEGREGLFVGMPQETGIDGKWYNTVIPLRRNVKDAIEDVVLSAYKGGNDGAAERRNERENSVQNTPDSQLHW